MIKNIGNIIYNKKKKQITNERVGVLQHQNAVHKIMEY